MEDLERRYEDLGLYNIQTRNYQEDNGINFPDDGYESE